jgi:hypothetical protein
MGFFLLKLGCFGGLDKFSLCYWARFLAPSHPILAALLFFVIGLGFEPNIFSLGLVLRRFSFSEKFLAKIHKKKNKKMFV